MKKRPSPSGKPIKVEAEHFDIFLSWSGHSGYEVGPLFRAWIKNFLPEQKFFFSPDIDRGVNWRETLLDKLSDLNTGVVLLTPEALHSSWVLYECGALAKQDGSTIYPILLDVDPNDVKGPLDLPNGTRFELNPLKEGPSKAQFFNLVTSLQKRLGIRPEGSETKFNRLWDQFATAVRSVLLAHRSDRKSANKGLARLTKFLDQESCTVSSLKQDVIRDLIFDRAAMRIDNVAKGRIELQAYDSVNYIAFNFLRTVKILRPGDLYFAVAAMNFFAGNRMLHGVENFITACASARKSGAGFQRYLLIDGSQINSEDPNDPYTLLKKVIKEQSRQLRKEGHPKGFEHYAIIFPTRRAYRKAVKDLKGFALIQRGDQFLALLPENVKTEPGSKSLGKLNLYFDCSEHDEQYSGEVKNVRGYLDSARKLYDSEELRHERLD